MKNDNKVFSIYILIILLYGLSYWFTSGKSFAFSPEYSDFGLGIIALGLFFHKKVTKYSFLLVSLGLSFFYLIAATKGFNLIDKFGFIQLKNLSLLVFSLILFWDLYKHRYRSLRIELAILGLLIIGFFVLRFTNFDWAFTREFSFYKNTVGFLIICWILERNKRKSSLSIPLKRVAIVVGLSFFIEMVTYLVRMF